MIPSTLCCAFCGASAGHLRVVEKAPEWVRCSDCGQRSHLEDLQRSPGHPDGRPLGLIPVGVTPGGEILWSQPQVKAPAPTCPRCEEAKLTQLVAARSFGQVGYAPGLWHCATCGYQCDDSGTEPWTTDQQIEQCRREDERRGTRRGGSDPVGRAKQRYHDFTRNPLQESPGGRKDRTVIRKHAEKPVAYRPDQEEAALITAIKTVTGVSQSEVIRWATRLSWEGLMRSTWCADCQALVPAGEQCKSCGLTGVPFRDA